VEAVRVNPDCKLRRCAIVFVEPRDGFDLDLKGLFEGRNAVVARTHWIALAPHVGDEIGIDATELDALSRIGSADWTSFADAARSVPPKVLDELIRKGLLISDDAESASFRERDERVRDTHWSPLAATSHYFSRWTDAGMDGRAEVSLRHSLADIVEEFGPPPPHLVEKSSAFDRIALARSEPSGLHELMRRRTTCRNFAIAVRIPSGMFAAVLERVFGCHADVELQPGVRALKKSNPSGGGLHPLEAYVLIQRVDGIAPGLYHYHAGTHALEPIAALSPAEAMAAAHRFVAGQQYLADAPVLIAIVARFARSFWKYRKHPKAYRAIVLEAGHVAQNLYLAATELGLGAFVTAAINEVAIERACELDALDESPLAVCGLGQRAETKTTVEFDPLGRIWNDDQLAAPK
jgi:putative peptide maturation dehydrogenase